VVPHHVLLCVNIAFYLLSSSHWKQTVTRYVMVQRNSDYIRVNTLLKEDLAILFFCSMPLSLKAQEEWGCKAKAEDISTEKVNHLKSYHGRSSFTDSSAAVGDVAAVFSAGTQFQSKLSLSVASHECNYILKHVKAFLLLHYRKGSMSLVRALYQSFRFKTPKYEGNGNHDNRIDSFLYHLMVRGTL
jgi:hypothetical protein